MTIAKLPVFYKQRDLLFYPSRAYSLPTWVLKIPITFVEVVVWVFFTYYVIGYDPNVESLLRQYLLLLLVNQVASGLFRFIAAIERNMIVANTFRAFALLILLVLGVFILSQVNEFLGKQWRHIPVNATEPLGVLVIKSRGFFPHANPSMIFMDEPTSGLDVRAVAIVMRTVRNNVDTGRTVLCTIHQPSINIFEAFDGLFLMKRGGQEIYVGPLGRHSCHLISYFKGVEGVGKIKDGYNPATWMLKVTSGAHENILKIDFTDIYKKSELYGRNKALINELSASSPGSKDLHFATRYSQCIFVQCFDIWYNITIDDIFDYTTELYVGEGTFGDISIGDTITWPMRFVEPI
ncbi:hypothetical protein IFM89_008370 [Coptis chinensis]|uniref:ABC-2 type transporter transmembrane domain-containing protein n=1 Tax=Coptis chinensis TaxID=261450 RepID=A0A835IQ97_9MAGN|nr:hypothetical protein IFM89_008370 [Coptis chinensis]